MSVGGESVDVEAELKRVQENSALPASLTSKAVEWWRLPTSDVVSLSIPPLVTVNPFSL